MHIACICACSAQVLKLLLVTFPESARLPDKVKGRLPVHYTCLYGSPFEIAILVEAEERALVYKDSSGKTPLDLAQFSENPHREAILRRLSDKTLRITESIRRRRRDSMVKNDEGVAKALQMFGPSYGDKKKVSSRQKSKASLSREPPDMDVDTSPTDGETIPPHSQSKDRGKLDTSSNHSKTNHSSREEDLQDKMSNPTEDGEKPPSLRSYDGKIKKMPENKHPLVLTSADEDAIPQQKNLLDVKTPSLEETEPPQEGEAGQGVNSKEEKKAVSDDKDEQPSPFSHGAETPLQTNSFSQKSLPAPWNMAKTEVSTSRHRFSLNTDSSAAPVAEAESVALVHTPFGRSHSMIVPGNSFSKAERRMPGTSAADMKRVSGKKISKSNRSSIRKSLRVSELLNGTKTNPSSKDDIDIETMAQQRNNRKLQMLLLNSNPKDTSPEDNELTSIGASSLPAHIQSQLWSGSLRPTDIESFGGLFFNNEARSQSHTDSSDQEITGEAAKEVAAKDADLFKVEAQIRNLDVRKEALSQECTHLYKSVALKQEDVDKCREKIIAIQRKLIEYQAKLEKEQGFWELAVTSIEIQKETLAEHESKMEQVERDRKTLVTKKEQLLEERQSCLDASKATGSAQVDIEKTFNDSSVAIFDV